MTKCVADSEYVLIGVVMNILSSNIIVFVKNRSHIYQ